MKADVGGLQVKRTSSRVLIVAVVAATFAMLFPGQAWAPRSWFLPAVNVSCVLGNGTTEEFNGAMELNDVMVGKGAVRVDGTLSGSCGTFAIDTPFNASIAAEDASCAEADLVVGDVLVKDMLIKLSEQPVHVDTEDVGRGPLCRLAASANAPLKAQAAAIAKVLSYLA